MGLTAHQQQVIQRLELNLKSHPKVQRNRDRSCGHGLVELSTTLLLVQRCILKLSNSPGPGCSKLTMSLVKISLKFQMLISEICQYFFVEKM